MAQRAQENTLGADTLPAISKPKALGSLGIDLEIRWAVPWDLKRRLALVKAARALFAAWGKKYQAAEPRDTIYPEALLS